MAECTEPAYLSVDIGTGSVRVALFSSDGAKLGLAQVRPIKTINPAPNHHEQSTADIWAALCSASRACIEASGRSPSAVAAVGIDATCSLVAVRSDDGTPVSVGNNPAFDGELHSSTVSRYSHSLFGFSL
jgi:D-ribulokinase